MLSLSATKCALKRAQSLMFGAPLTVINTINTLYNLQIYVGHALSTQKLDVQRRKTKAMRCLSPVGQCLAGLPK